MKLYYQPITIFSKITALFVLKKNDNDKNEKKNLTSSYLNKLSFYFTNI